VEGREGIGAMYYVTVVPTGGSGGGTETILWADVEDMKQPGALVLKDLNTGKGASDLTDSDDNTPVLYCKTAADGKGDVQFWLNTDSGTYDWVVKNGGSAIASGTLNSGNSWTASQSDLSPSIYWYRVEVTKQGDQNFKRSIDFVILQTAWVEFDCTMAEDSAASVVTATYGTIWDARWNDGTPKTKVYFEYDRSLVTTIRVHAAQATSANNGVQLDGNKVAPNGDNKDITMP